MLRLIMCRSLCQVHTDLTHALGIMIMMGYKLIYGDIKVKFNLIINKSVSNHVSSAQFSSFAAQTEFTFANDNGWI